MNKTNIYFHGSSEPKISKLDAPSYEHPFYVTTDLHYAMAFCTKTQSSTGEYASKKLNFTPSSQNYVYVVSLNPNAKLLDFRDHSSKQFKVAMSQLIPDELMRYVESVSRHLDMSDIYEFCIALDELFTQIGDSSYVEYINSNNGKDVLSPKLFLQAKSLMQKLRWDSNKDMHSIMAPILKHLHSKGYQGIVTREHDTNNDLQPGSNRVDTTCAIGIFDIAGLDAIGLVPMRYNWLKKINPSYLQNATSKDARQKIKRFIQLYKLVAMKDASLDESQVDASHIWYFGNNRSKNLRIVKPAWYKPFFLTTSYEYAKDYADYGVYKIQLADQQKLNILNFNDANEVRKLNWPEIVIKTIQAGKNDLNSIAYDLYVLAYGEGKKQPTWIEDSEEWRLAAYYFRDKSLGILDYAASGSVWGSEEDHAFLMQMWKDIYDAGFDGFMHIEFGQKVLALFDLRCIGKISPKPISQKLDEKTCAKAPNMKPDEIYESMHISQTLYRFCIGNVGVYEAAKDLIFSIFDVNEAKKKWSEVLAASSWLPKPNFQYSKEYESWFTLAGKNLFEKTVLCVLRRLGIDNIELCKSVVNNNRIVYSDIYQVIVKSDKLNENDKNDVNDIKSLFDEIVSQYKTIFDIDLSYMKFKVDSQPVYTNGEPCYEYDEDECAGDWTSLGWIRLNPDMQSVMDRYGVAWHGTDDIEDFTKIIIAHELAHEVWNNIADDQFKNDVIEKANDENFNTMYLNTVNPNKLAEETFCEYLAHKIVQQRKKIDFPEEEMQDLSKRKHIVTHRVSDDALLFNVGDIVDAPWQIPYKITKKNVVNDIYDSPYVDQLSQEQLEYLQQFDSIAILDLDAQYEPPYTLEQIKSKYPEHIYNKLANDPIHRWRAETGIELIHKEPTEEEQQRTWKNWQLMPQEMKDISDKKSLEMFGCTNAQHYAQLKRN